jgi:hypothetical protein
MGSGIFLAEDDRATRSSIIVLPGALAGFHPNGFTFCAVALGTALAGGFLLDPGGGTPF